MPVLSISCKSQLHDVITEVHDIKTESVPLYSKQAQRVGRGIAVPIFDPAGLVKATLRPLYFRDKDTVTTIQEAVSVSGPAWEGLKNLSPTGFRNSNGPARSQSLYLVRYPGKKGKKAIPLKAWTGPGGSRRLRFPDFKTIKGGKVVSPTHRPLLPPGNIPGTHFC